MTKDEYIASITKAMQDMKIYRQEFDITIEAAAIVSELRDRNLAEWKAHGFEQVTVYTNKGKEQNLVKSPFYDNNLKYNDQILKYYKSLGLTPNDAAKLGVVLDDIDDGMSEFEI